MSKITRTSTLHIRYLRQLKNPTQHIIFSLTKFPLISDLIPNLMRYPYVSHSQSLQNLAETSKKQLKYSSLVIICQ